MSNHPPRIYAALLTAMSEAAETGIAKLTKNKDQGYYFRGIEAAMNEMAPILIRNKIVVVPSYVEHVESARETKSGGTMKFVRVKGVFKFVHAEDGSSVESICWGEGMDVSDKATTKAQSVAFRTALFTTFVVPTQAVHIDNEGDDGAAGAGDTEADRIGKLVDDLIAEAKKTTTDAAALKFWKDNNAKLAEHPNAHAELKQAVANHRRALAANTTGATA